MGVRVYRKQTYPLRPVTDVTAVSRDLSPPLHQDVDNGPLTTVAPQRPLHHNGRIQSPCERSGTTDRGSTDAFGFSSLGALAFGSSIVAGPSIAFGSSMAFV